MSIFNISQEDINRSKQPGKGWHFGITRKYTEKASKDKTGINYTFEIEVTDTQGEKSNIGRFAYKLFSNKAPGFFLPFYSAVMDIPQDSIEAGKVNLDDCVEKKLWFEVEEVLDASTGKVNRNIENFQPASATPPF